MIRDHHDDLEGGAAGFRELQAARGRRPGKPDALDAAIERLERERDKSRAEKANGRETPIEPTDEGPPPPAVPRRAEPRPEAAPAAAVKAGPRPTMLRRLDQLAMGAPFLQVDGLTAGRGAADLVHGFDLRLARGQSLCLAGPEGSGKSAVLDALYGFLEAREGAIQVGEGIDCVDITKTGPNDRLATASMAYVMQEPSCFGGMTVEENILMGAYLRRGASETRRAAEAAFDRFPNLEAKRDWRADELDAAESRLLELCRALVMEPAILLVDEPCIGVRDSAVAAMYQLLTALQASDGLTMIIAERPGGPGEAFADVVYRLERGALASAERTAGAPGRPAMAGGAEP